MVTENDVQHIAELADVGISPDELGTFTHQFNAILEYFDILDCVEGTGQPVRELYAPNPKSRRKSSLDEDEMGDILIRTLENKVRSTK